MSGKRALVWTQASPSSSGKGKRRKTARSIYRPLRPFRTLSLGMPTSYTCKLRYCDDVFIDPGAALIAAKVYSCNGLYDPDQSVGGHQPNPFDQLMVFYSKATVTGAKITVRPIYQDTGTDLTAGMLTILKSDTGTAYSGFGTMWALIESDSARKYSIVGNHTTLDNPPNGGFVTATWGARNWFRVRDVTGHEEYASSESANPQRQAFFEICYGHIQANNPAGRWFFVEIEYTATFTQPKNTPSS